MKKLLVRLVRQSPAMIVAMLALFVALTGTAVATTSALIGSAQIRNNSITGLDVKNRSLRPIDFRGSVRGPRGLRGLTGATGAPGAAGAKGDKGDKGDPATRLWAFVTTNGTTATLVRGSGALAATQTNPGFINVQFNQNVNACAWLVTTGRDDFALPPRGGATADRNPPEPDKVYVQTFDSAGSAAPRDFSLAVFC